MKKNYYVDGTSVRELHAAPARSPRVPSREEERIRKEKKRRNAIQRNRERQLSMNFGFVSFLTVCVVLCGLAASMLIHYQSECTQHLKQIAVVQGQINDLRALNNEKEKRLNTSLDMNKVKDIAVNQLGMVYPSEEQIVYYSVEHSNYMDQYENIPE